MAITTAVYKKNISNVGVWSGSDVINQLEEAFLDWGAYSQDDQGGYIVGLNTGWEVEVIQMKPMKLLCGRVSFWGRNWSQISSL